MKKLLTGFSFLVLFLFLFSSKTFAATCTFTYDQSTLVSGTNSVKITTIDSQKSLSSNTSYYLHYSSPSICGTRTPCPYVKVTTDANGNIQNAILPEPVSFNDGPYSVTLNPGIAITAPLCNSSFSVGGTAGSGGNGCTASVISDNLQGRDAATSTEFTPNNTIFLRTSGITGTNPDQDRIQVKLNDQNGAVLYDEPGTILNGELVFEGSTPPAQSPISLGSFPSGTYYVSIHDSYRPAGFLEQQICFTTFMTSPTCDSSCGDLRQGGANGPLPICLNPGSDGACNEIASGLGPIGTNPSTFVQFMLGIILSLAGGIAVILIIISGYRLIASQGNPEKIVAAREQLTAAIVGLLFVIFSLFILQVIGVDILNLPGFGK